MFSPKGLTAKRPEQFQTERSGPVPALAYHTDQCGAPLDVKEEPGDEPVYVTVSPSRPESYAQHRRLELVIDSLARLCP